LYRIFSSSLLFIFSLNVDDVFAISARYYLCILSFSSHSFSNASTAFVLYASKASFTVFSFGLP